jgi:hypothetical protein
MSVASDVKKDMKAAQKIWLPWWGMLCLLLVGLPLFWVFDHFATSNLALPTWNIAAVFGFVVYLKWSLRRNGWLWITIAILVALHVPLLLFLPWTTKWVPAVAIAGIDAVDLILILIITAVVGKFFERPKINPESH